MKICFILPRYTRRPIGGYKIVFEYANRLLSYDNEVSILFLNDNALSNLPLSDSIRKMGIEIMTQIEPNWFPLDKKIKKISGKKNKDTFDDYDVCIATSVETVKPVMELFDTDRKYYLVQDFENWSASDEEVIQSFKKGLKIIVISQWLKDVVETQASVKAELIKNPIDVKTYKVIEKIEERKAHTIGLLYHTGKHKGLKYSFRVLEKLKEFYPDMTVKMFGNPARPADLPKWIHYIRHASVEETVKIYNSIAVFICSSIEEGFGLTGMEAMACGAAVVSSKYRGVLEYAIDDFNAKLSEIRDVDAMVQNVRRLFDDDKERVRIAYNGVESLKTNGWEQAVKKMNKILNEDV